LGIMMKLRKESIPWAMAASRALLGPVIIVGERCGWSGVALASVVVTALLSDIFDGVLASACSIPWPTWRFISAWA
jgi:hypothetical protein